ncbi:MAG TPA: YggT family protein, partial [Ktedonobacteraceae bacterium]|nr:YggT family protein [Ktedonobacteraceae bacterium]
KLNDFIQWFIAVLEVTLAIRFVLKLIGADPNNLFAGFLYALTDIILFPFSTIVRSPSIHPPYQAFEWSTLIAMAIYALVFWAIGRFLRILISSPEEPTT